MQQSFAFGAPQTPPPPQMPQSLAAFAAQEASHAMSQQEMSTAHTTSQQAALAQPGVWLAMQQSFASGWPQTPRHADGLQVASAASAQMKSHRVLQQNGSAAQIVSQQVASEQPGVMLAEQQSFAFGAPQFAVPPPSQSAGSQTCTALWAQARSQLTEQQFGSIAQTASQQAASEQPGNWPAVQQLPAFGLPQTLPPPPPPHGLHSAPASFAQPMSQPKMQHVGSIAQTASQHAASEQPGVWLGVQQSLPFGSPQMSLHVVHSCSACAAHDWLHASMQQNGSTAQTASQQVASEQPGNTLVEQQSLGLVFPQPPPPWPEQVWQN
jgi:hypothetical protein